MRGIPTIAICLLGVSPAVVTFAQAQNQDRQRTSAIRNTSRDSQERRGIVIDAEYPGGNIRLGRIQEDTVDLQQDLRDTNGERWFYWNFRVRGVAGRMLCFKFANGNPIGVRGPAVSTDGGRAWSWLGAKAVNDTSFHYAFAKNAGEIRFCFAVPYQQADLQRFLGRHADSEYLSFGQGDPTIGPEVVAGKAQGRM